MIQRPSLILIFDRLKARLRGAVASSYTTAVPRVSVYGILSASWSGVIHGLYGYIDNFAKQMFPKTASIDYLRNFGEMYDYKELKAAKSKCEVRIQGTVGIVIPLGTEFTNYEAHVYLTDAEYTINAFGYYDARLTAENAGIDPAQNQVVGTSSLSLVNPIPGVTSVAYFTIAPYGGRDDEQVEEYRARLSDYIADPPAGGRDSDYVRWAKEVPGVYKAWTFDVIYGTGTVGISIAGLDNAVVDAQVKSDCEDYINEKRTLGIRVYIFDIERVNAELDISLSQNVPQFRDAIQANIETLFTNFSKPGQKILLSDINSAIHSSGVPDYTINDISYNGVSIGVNNIEPTGFEVPFLNYIDWSDL